jgi:hypothetical protein
MDSNFQSSMPLPPEHYKLIDPSNPMSLPPPPIPSEKTIHVFGVPIHEVYIFSFSFFCSIFQHSQISIIYEHLFLILLLLFRHIEIN